MKNNILFIKTFLALFKVNLKVVLASVLILFSLFKIEANPIINQPQEVVTGTVTDEDGIPLPDVNIIISGTTQGTQTDFDGNYSIEASKGDVLVFSYIGMKQGSVTVGDSKIIDVILIEDANSLDEVIVVGYGTVKKKLSTGASINVKGEDIEELTPATAMEALQGISPGVNVTQNSGQPGVGTKVYIRGIGTTGNSKPLYVVDGVIVGNIDYLSPSDIESINVLKDAASSAIYGARAANGVILVTTIKGKKEKSPKVSFDSYVGFQNVYKNPGLLNAQEYAFIMNEGQINDGKAPFDFASMIPSWGEVKNGWEGTNWFKEMTTYNAPVTNSTINITGGSDRIIYSMGAANYDQTGIVGGDLIDAGYKRFTLRMNTELVLAKKDEMDLIVIGENLTYTNSSNKRVADGNIYWNDIHNALVTNPFMPVYTDGEYTRTYDAWTQGQPNPIALMDYDRNHSWNKNNTVVGNFYVKIQPFKNFVIKSTYGINAWFGNSRGWIPPYNLGTLNSRIEDQVTQSMYQGSNWVWTNTISYDYLSEKHSITALIGTEMNKNKLSLSLSGSARDSNFYDPKKAYLNNVNIRDISQLISLNGIDWAAQGGGLLSYFARISYNYKEKYLFTGVIRADGSSNFAEDKRWGIFPSMSLGWVISKEAFLSESNIINLLKLRASWGQNGNQAIPNYGYSSSISTGGSYFFGDNNMVSSPISYPARVPNLDTTWETSEQLNIGLDAQFFSSKLFMTLDWYKKNTKDWLVSPPILATSGAPGAYVNGGEIQNQGYEISLGWRERETEFTWGITANLAYNDNEVIHIANEEKIIHGPNNVLSQGTSELFRAEVGHPIGYFWGYKTDGILQNQADIDAYVNADGNPYFDDLRAGDIRFVDLNGDGVIDDNDKTELGDPLPDFIFGLQLNAEFKGVYASATFTGQAGMQVMKSYRSFADQFKQNYTTEIFDRWHGEGTSNRIPRLSSTSHRNTNFISDIYMHDADFVRFSNFTIGYSFNHMIENISFISNLKIYASGKNLYTFTKYNGLDPEVGYGPTPWSSGIDLGLYPSARTYLVGINVTF